MEIKKPLTSQPPPQKKFVPTNWRDDPTGDPRIDRAMDMKKSVSKYLGYFRDLLNFNTHNVSKECGVECAHRTEEK